MCTGRVDLSFPLRAFLAGADGVFVGGCWLGECHYLTDGNYDALGNMHLLRKLFQRIGIDPRRLRIEWVGASEGIRFADVMNGFVAEITALGPTGTSEGVRAEVLKPKLQALCAMVPQLKLLVREKLQVRVKSAEAYEKLYASPATDALIDALMADPAATAQELPAYWIDPDKCVGCLICQKKCPAHAIEGASKSIHVIDQDVCTRCGTCFYSCPPKIGAIRKVAGEPVPPPVPAAERLVVRGSRSGA